MSLSDKLEVLPSESPGSDPERVDILTCFWEPFGVDGGWATSGGGEGCCGGCLDAGTHAMSGDQGGLDVGLVPS